MIAYKEGFVLYLVNCTIYDLMLRCLLPNCSYVKMLMTKLLTVNYELLPYSSQARARE
jgi:hypothetical protein